MMHCRTMTAIYSGLPRHSIHDDHFKEPGHTLRHPEDLINGKLGALIHVLYIGIDCMYRIRGKEPEVNK